MSCESRSHKETVVLMETSLGNIKVKLYDDTPAHRDNFIKLVEEGYYDGTLFHRVINEFMIQGGDGTSKNAPAGKMLGTGDILFTQTSFIRNIFINGVLWPRLGRETR